MPTDPHASGREPEEPVMGGVRYSPDYETVDQAYFRLLEARLKAANPVEDADVCLPDFMDEKSMERESVTQEPEKAPAAAMPVGGSQEDLGPSLRPGQGGVYPEALSEERLARVKLLIECARDRDAGYVGLLAHVHWNAVAQDLDALLQAASEREEMRKHSDMQHVGLGQALARAEAAERELKRAEALLSAGRETLERLERERAQSYSDWGDIRAQLAHVTKERDAARSSVDRFDPDVSKSEALALLASERSAGLAAQNECVLLRSQLASSQANVRALAEAGHAYLHRPPPFSASDVEEAQESKRALEAALARPGVREALEEKTDG